MFVMGEKLNQWVLKKMDQKKWRQAELARQAGLTPQYLSNVLQGKREPGIKFYKGISEAFGVSMDAIERLDSEGIEPDDIEGLSDDVTLREIMDLTKRMTPEQRKKALEFVIYVWRTGRVDRGIDDEPRTEEA